MSVFATLIVVAIIIRSPVLSDVIFMMTPPHDSWVSIIWPPKSLFLCVSSSVVGLTGCDAT